ncbi:hypothetical protein HDE_04071 [Halotydeus destructor]|nr:hypothetical protein HDE_04071 [Halotydeus destructor]
MSETRSRIPRLIRANASRSESKVLGTPCSHVANGHAATSGRMDISVQLTPARHVRDMIKQCTPPKAGMVELIRRWPPPQPARRFNRPTTYGKATANSSKLVNANTIRRKANGDFMTKEWRSKLEKIGLLEKLKAMDNVTIRSKK